MTHAELVDRAERWLRGTARCSVVVRELWSMSMEIPDAIGWRGNQSTLIECKATRADFLSDAKKPHRMNPDWGMGELRYYMTPPGLISVDELPARWGLLEAGPRVVRVKMYAAGFPRMTAAWRERPLLIKALKKRMGAEQ